ncbi:MAG: DUF3365 domain-containing protein [Planctomycetota bacterium]
MRAVPLCLFLFVACSDPEPPPFTRTPEEAQRLAFEASGELMGALVTVMANAVIGNEPHKALHLCADIAQEKSKEVEARFGFPLRRTALRYRNPANAPDDFERAYMEKVAASGTLPTEPYVEVVGDELRYLRAIGLAQICTVCHGPRASLDPKLLEVLAERYPDDRATDFVPGDFRGVVSVRVPLRSD